MIENLFKNIKMYFYALLKSHLRQRNTFSIKFSSDKQFFDKIRQKRKGLER